MAVMFVLLPVALAFAAAALAVFLIAVRTGQFDDLETPAVRILLEEDAVAPNAAPGARCPVRDPGAPAEASLPRWPLARGDGKAATIIASRLASALRGHRGSGRSRAPGERA